SRCMNNLKQINLATHMYHDEIKHLPPSRLSDLHATWAVYLMPYLEQQNLYSQWNIPQPYYNQTQVARTTAVPTYFCPSRRSPPGDPPASISGDFNDDPGPGPHTPGALGDYAACTGTDNCDGADCIGKVNGAFHAAYDQNLRYLGYVRFETIRDGLSNTIFFGEKHVQQGNFGRGPLDCSVYNGDYWVCSTRSAGPNYTLATSRTDTAPTFGSYHTSICHFALGDGSVRPIAVSIDPKILAMLADIADGGVLPDF
ncbi:MAG: DUF1559 domain-containing protein, partial [Gemmataceae bacterium]